MVLCLEHVEVIAHRLIRRCELVDPWEVGRVNGESEIEDSVRNNRLDHLAAIEDLQRKIEPAPVLVEASSQEICELRVLHNPRKHDLRKRCGTHFQHLGHHDCVDVAAEVLVLVGVINLDPATAAARPRNLLRDALHRDAGHVANDVGEPNDLRRIKHHILVDLIEQQETGVLAGNAHDLLKVGTSVGDTERIVRADHQNADDLLVLAHRVFQGDKVNAAALIELQRIGDVMPAMVNRFGGCVRRIGRIRTDHPGRSA